MYIFPFYTPELHLLSITHCQERRDMPQDITITSLLAVPASFVLLTH